MINFLKYTDALANVRLFDGITKDDIKKMLDCMGASARSYQKEELILCAGGDIPGVGIVLSGVVQIVKEDIYARRSIMANLDTGDIFAEVFACAGITKSPVTAVAAADAEVMFISFERIVTVCPSTCGFHTALIRNMLKLIAEKNLMLNKKIDYLLIKGLRERLAAYLLEQGRQRQSAQFDIPFDRSGLADYLNADRSALSRELGRMKDEGLLDYYKNSFRLLDIEKMYAYLA